MQASEVSPITGRPAILGIEFCGICQSVIPQRNEAHNSSRQLDVGIKYINDA